MGDDEVHDDQEPTDAGDLTDPTAASVIEPLELASDDDPVGSPAAEPAMPRATEMLPPLELHDDESPPGDTLPTGPPVVSDAPSSTDSPSPYGPAPWATAGQGSDTVETPAGEPSPWSADADGHPTVETPAAETLSEDTSEDTNDGEPPTVDTSAGGPHMALVLSRLLAWFALAMAVRQLISVLGGGWRFWNIFQGILLIWGTALLVFRHPLLMEGFYRLPNAEAVLQRFGPKLRLAVASMILVGLAQVLTGTFDMILHGIRALFAALVVGAVMVAPAVLEYRWRDTWADTYPPSREHWPGVPGFIGRIAGLLLEHEDIVGRVRAASPDIVKVGTLSFLCGLLLFWGNGPFGNQWLGSSRSPEMDLLSCVDYNVREGADAWEAQNVEAKEWTYSKEEPPDCWVECVHRQWTEQKKRAANVDTLSDLALLVGPKCCEQCSGDYERGTTSRNSYCCL